MEIEQIFTRRRVGEARLSSYMRMIDRYGREIHQCSTNLMSKPRILIACLHQLPPCLMKLWTKCDIAVRWEMFYFRRIERRNFNWYTGYAYHVMAVPLGLAVLFAYGFILLLSNTPKTFNLQSPISTTKIPQTSLTIRNSNSRKVDLIFLVGKKCWEQALKDCLLATGPPPALAFAAPHPRVLQICTSP